MFPKQNGLLSEFYICKANDILLLLLQTVTTVMFSRLVRDAKQLLVMGKKSLTCL